jgi:fucose 4-O-acetylase-like acetyltransferase
MSLPARDTFLDCLKGLAIGTVVLGHTFQGATDFDHFLPFRIIYSFHMPMFMFVAGMTASLSFSKRRNKAPAFTSLIHDIGSRALRLVLPFLTWAVIQYFVAHPQGYSATSWVAHVIEVPDNGLWFLWVLFQCSCVLALVEIALQYVLHSLNAPSAEGNNDSPLLYLLLILAWPITLALLRVFSSQLALGMTAASFPYFFAGFIFHIIRPAGLPNAIRWIPYIVFIALAPFWYRIEISPLAMLFKNPAAANLEYQRIVAVAGTLALVDFARLFASHAPALLSRAVAYTGTRSLDIYAIHFYFLGYFPPVIAPVVASLGASFVLRTNFVTSWLCLGQKPLKIWPMERYRLFAGRSAMTNNAVAMPKE